MPISLRLDRKDEQLIRTYAKTSGITVSELVRLATLEKIENEIDIKTYNKAWAEFEANPAIYTLDEVKKELGL